MARSSTSSKSSASLSASRSVSERRASRVRAAPSASTGDGEDPRAAFLDATVSSAAAAAAAAAAARSRSRDVCFVLLAADPRPFDGDFRDEEYGLGDLRARSPVRDAFSGAPVVTDVDHALTLPDFFDAVSLGAANADRGLLMEAW